VAIVLGAEGKGLRQLTRDSCDHLVRLDMNGPIKSLNVSNACAVTLYALTR
jgi:23S rRNA (guanosine2251-2'-O)-methyltransferase